LDQYTIPKIRALLLLASNETEVSFDTASPAMDRLIEYTKQDPCAMFTQAQFVLNIPYSEGCLTDVIVYIDFSGIFDRAPKGRVLELQERAKTMFHPEGITLDLGKGPSRYVAFERSASMSRSNVLSFVREDVYVPLKERIQLGMSIGECQLSKLYAYNGLMYTSGERYEIPGLLSEGRIVVIDNPKTIVNADVITVEDDGTDAPVRKYHRVRKTMDVEVKEFDGEGLISKELSKLLGGGHHSFQIRLPYIKGVVHEVDIKRLFSNMGMTHVTDMWGERHPVEAVDMILTSSMFKGVKWMEANGLSWEEYLDRCEKYGHALYVSGKDKPRQENTTTFNYQFLNTAAMPAEDFRPLDLPLGWETSPEDDPREWMTKTTETAYYNIVADRNAQINYLKHNKNRFIFCDSDEWSIRYLIADNNPLLFGERVFVRELETRAKRILDEYGVGHLMVSGDNRYLSDDLMRLFVVIGEQSGAKRDMLNRLRSEMLSGNEFYAPDSSKRKPADYGRPIQDKYLLLRSPHISRNEEAVAVPAKFHTPYRDMYLAHLSYVVMVDSRSLIPERLGGADYDGDMVKTIAEPVILKHTVDSEKLPVLKIPAAEPLISDANDWEARFESVKNTFSSRVGQISNAALKRGIMAYNENADPADRQRYAEEAETLAILTGLEIDSAKSGIKPDLSEYFDNESRTDSLFLKYLKIVETAHPSEKKLKSYFASVDWDSVTSNMERLPYYARMLGNLTPRHFPETPDPKDLFNFAGYDNWKTFHRSHEIEFMNSLVRDYETAKRRCRAREYDETKLSRLGDIKRILYAKGKDAEIDPLELYRAVDNGSAGEIRTALAELKASEWQFTPPDKRDEVFERIVAHLNEKAYDYAELFCDFRGSGYRILGDILLDLDNVYRREIGLSTWTRADDSDILKRLVAGCEDSKDPYWTIHNNLIEILRENGLADFKWRFFSAVSLAYATGNRSFAIEALLGSTMGMLKKLPKDEKDGEKHD